MTNLQLSGSIPPHGKATIEVQITPTRAGTKRLLVDIDAACRRTSRAKKKFTFRFWHKLKIDNKLGIYITNMLPGQDAAKYTVLTTPNNSRSSNLTFFECFLSLWETKMFILRLSSRCGAKTTKQVHFQFNKHWVASVLKATATDNRRTNKMFSVIKVTKQPVTATEV